jgi:hypothetical protein
VTRFLEQQINIKFCNSAGETLALLALACGEYMKKPKCFEWHRRFNEGRDVQDGGKSWQPKR